MRVATAEDLELERRALGFYLSGHPAAAHAGRLGTLAAALAAPPGGWGAEPLSCAALVRRTFERRTRAGEWMGVAFLEDARTRCEAVCFARRWAELADAAEGLVGQVAHCLVQPVRDGRGLVLEGIGPADPPPAPPPDEAPWLEEFAALDLETATPPGREFSVEEERVVEVGAALFRLRQRRPPGARWSWSDYEWRCEARVSRLCDPGFPIGTHSAAVHGITTEDVRGQPTFAERAPALARVLAGRVLVTYNGDRFDELVARAEFARGGARFPDVAGHVDCYHLARRRYPPDPRRPASRQLGDQCAHFGVEVGRAHRAGDDAAATGRLLCALQAGGWAPRGLAALLARCAAARAARVDRALGTG